MNSLDLQAPPPAAAPIVARHASKILSLPAACWGKINHKQRWFPLAMDYGRAMSVARLGDYERMLIFAIQERSWGEAAVRKNKADGWPDAIPVTITMNSLADELASDDETVRKMLYRARKSLVESGMIRDGGKGLEIETDVSRWTGRIDPKFFAYCLAGRPKSNDQAAHVSPNISHSKVTESSHSTVTSHFSVLDQSLSSAPPVTLECSDSHSTVTTPIRNAPASEDFKKTEEDSSSSSGPEEASIPMTIKAEAGAPEKPKGPRPPETLDELWDWASVAVDESEDIHGKLRGWCAGYPVSWVHAGLMSAMAMARRGKVAGYVNSCLLRWQAKGGPDFEAGTPGSAPSSGPRYWSGGVPPLTPEVVAGRSEKIREVIAKLPPWEPTPSLSVVPSPGPVAIDPGEMARLAAETRALAERLRASNPKRGARRA